MNKIEKLLRKISKKERNNLLICVNIIISGDSKLKTVKIKNTDFYRTKYKQFRIIFHKEKNEIIIDNIRMRNESTYKNL
ncbi:hypothetical protein KAI92_01215 [Candidatus Parcubacteria bacterium]|nr:hypothetical protein [Candidatus Parcubacteria bacterium]